MPITLVEADLIFPKGELKAAFFPDGSLSANIAVWLEEVEDKVDHLTDQGRMDRAAAAWIYCQAYRDIANRMAQLPRSESYYGDVSRSYDDRNISHWRKLADGHCALYEALAHQPTQRVVQRRSQLLQNRAVF